MVKWEATKKEVYLIREIVRRLGSEIDVKLDSMSLQMDIEAVHCNGNPLNLEAMLDAPMGDLYHDIAGIAQHLDRDTGHLQDCFSPRFSVRQ